MKLNFDLNNKRVDYELDTISGIIKASVDGVQVSRGFMMMGGRKGTSFKLDNSVVNIVINQPLFFAYFRNKTFEVYVDNKLYKVFNKKGNLIQG